MAVNCSPNSAPITISKHFFEAIFKEHEYSDLISIYALCCYLFNYEKITKTDDVIKNIANKLKWPELKVERYLAKLFELGCLS